MSEISASHRIGIAIVGSDSLYRDLLRQGLSAVPGFAVVGTFADGEIARRGIPESTSVAIIDADLAGPLGGIPIGMMMRARIPRMGVVWLADRLQPYFAVPLERTVGAGWAYLLKQSTTLADLTRVIEGTARGLAIIDPLLPDVSAGRSRPLDVTRRQGEILALMAAGFTNAAIAEMLRLSGKSIQNQINQLYSRLEIDSGDSFVQPRVRAVLAYADRLSAVASEAS